MGIYRHQNTETNRMYNTGMPKIWDTETDRFTGDQGHADIGPLHKMETANIRTQRQ